MRRRISDSQHKTCFHGKFGQFHGFPIKGNQSAELPPKRFTEFRFRQVQMVGIGKDGQTIGEVEHILMKAPGRFFAVAEFIDDRLNDFRKQHVVLIWAQLLALQIEPAEQLLFLCGELNESHPIAAVAAVVSLVRF